MYPMVELQSKCSDARSGARKHCRSSAAASVKENPDQRGDVPAAVVLVVLLLWPPPTCIASSAARAASTDVMSASSCWSQASAAASASAMAAAMPSVENNGVDSASSAPIIQNTYQRAEAAIEG